jgi:tRNA(adenine34) deaminase
MEMAISEAKKAFCINEVPVGAVLLQGERVLSKAHNARISTIDPTGHAEILAIREAAKAIQNYRLTGASLYVTLEPCAMCFGAIMEARIGEVVFSVREPRSGVMGSLYDLHNDPRWGHKIIVREGVLLEPVQKLLRHFFQEKRLGPRDHIC